MDICDLNKCTGCFACMNICPCKAITVTEGYLDKIVPYINDNVCIKCGKCKSVCPVNNPVKKNQADFSIAAWSKNQKDKELSSSGGIAAVLSKFILSKDGIVFGTAFENKKCQIISINSIEDIEKIRGSKYVQSFTGLSFSCIREYLEIDKNVLFIGTPCQVAGLKNFLSKDYDNLFLVDLICHGVPPQKYLDDYFNYQLIDELFDQVSFRGKYDFKLTAYKDNKIIFQNDSSNDYYFSCFLNGTIFRDNCYQCPYSCIERCSDITIGDFWGINRTELLHPYNGRISLVLPNTKKGIELFNKCKDFFIWEKKTIFEACNEEQTNLIHPSLPSDDRKNFEKYYPLYGFTKTIRKYTNNGKSIEKKEIKNKIKKLYLFKIFKKIYKLFQ